MIPYFIKIPVFKNDKMPESFVVTSYWFSGGIVEWLESGCNLRKIHYLNDDFSLCHPKEKVAPLNSGLQSIVRDYLSKSRALAMNVHGFLTIVVRSSVSQKNYAPQTRKRKV
jgi:hypothetical protein